MVDHQTGPVSDKGIGFAALFFLLAVASAAVLLVSPGSDLGGWAFAAAMTVGALLVAGIHIYGY